MKCMKIHSSYCCFLSKTESMSSEDLKEKIVEHKPPTRKTSESPLIKRNKTDSINYFTGNISNPLFYGRESLSTSEFKEFVLIENRDKEGSREAVCGLIPDKKNGPTLIQNQNSEKEENLNKICHVPNGYKLKKHPNKMRKQSSFLINENNKVELNKSASPESFLLNKFNLEESIKEDVNGFEEFVNMAQKNNSINYNNHVYETVESIKILKELNPSLKE